MLRFTDIVEGNLDISRIPPEVGRKELNVFTNKMIDKILSLVARCTDHDVAFIPDDPDAYDPAAADDSEIYLSWTLGHVIAHVTASSEESAALAAEMARGVPDRGGRSRYEVPWRQVTTIDQCRRRLDESRRMRLASLEMWPDNPHLNNTKVDWRGNQIDAVAQFIIGLQHEASHLQQIENIVEQTRSRDRT